MIADRQATGSLRPAIRIVNDESGATQTNAIDLSCEKALRGAASPEDREPDARRADVYR